MTDFPEIPEDVRKDVRQRFEAIQRRIDDACRRSGRSPAEVTLVGASKLQPVERMQAAWEAGLRVFGENRVQEAEAKKPHLPPEAQWHLLGPLQSNKAKLAVQLFDAVHSLDRLKIARHLDRHVAEEPAEDEHAEGGPGARRLPCFLEINLGGEESKHGFAPAGLMETLEPLAACDHLDPVGLMAIPPPGETAEGSRRWFVELRGLRDRVAESGRLPGFRGWLSMGMSADFEVAIEEGATHVRLGTSLFGPRD
jgi:pyridoxal phosphate enzyme (YggS family)